MPKNFSTPEGERCLADVRRLNVEQFYIEKVAA